MDKRELVESKGVEREGVHLEGVGGKFGEVERKQAEGGKRTAREVFEVFRGLPIDRDKMKDLLKAEVESRREKHVLSEVQKGLDGLDANELLEASRLVEEL